MQVLKLNQTLSLPRTVKPPVSESFRAAGALEARLRGQRAAIAALIAKIKSEIFS